MTLLRVGPDGGDDIFGSSFDDSELELMASNDQGRKLSAATANPMALHIRGDLTGSDANNGVSDFASMLFGSPDLAI